MKSKYMIEKEKDDATWSVVVDHDSTVDNNYIRRLQYIKSNKGLKIEKNFKCDKIIFGGL